MRGALRRLWMASAGTPPVSHPRQLSSHDLAINRGAPWLLRWYGTAEMHRALREVCPSEFDGVIVDSLYMTLYRDLRVPRAVLQEHNIESQLARQLAERPRSDAPPERRPGDRSLWRSVVMPMETYENRTWPAFPLRVTVSQADKAVIDRRCATGRTIVVENGADVRAPSSL